MTSTGVAVGAAATSPGAAVARALWSASYPTHWPYVVTWDRGPECGVRDGQITRP
ncbi:MULTISPECIES: hypothetical protein [unclassified Kitasatospora]|uniref:hypothetical protein n=1 Tax=unclassified Kitasatospora TaxID=2633591 RepID=UPI003409E119